MPHGGGAQGEGGTLEAFNLWAATAGGPVSVVRHLFSDAAMMPRPSRTRERRAPRHRDSISPETDRVNMLDHHRALALLEGLGERWWFFPAGRGCTAGRQG